MIEITSPSAKNELDLLYYELIMLNNAFPYGYSPDNSIEENMRLESFLIHARNLIDFLEGCCQKDDIRCTDFIDKSNKPISPISLSIPDDLKIKINKHCQHLTKTRLEEKIKWKVNVITQKINRGIVQFVDQLNDKYPQHIKKKIETKVNDFLIIS